MAQRDQDLLSELPRITLPRTPVNSVPSLGGAASCGILPLVLLSKAYPANDAPGVEVARKLTLVAVARHQHDDTPLVYVLQVHRGCGPQIAREDFGGLDHHLLADPRLGDLPFQLRGAGPLPIHHGFLL